MAKRGMGDISASAAGNASVAILGGGLGILAASFVYATADATRSSLVIRALINTGLGVLGGMVIPGNFGHGFAAGLGGFGAIGLVAVAVAPDQIPEFRGFARALRGAGLGKNRYGRDGSFGHKSSGRSLAGTLLG